MMEKKLNKEIEFIGDKLNMGNHSTEFRIASYRTKDGSKFDLAIPANAGGKPDCVRADSNCFRCVRPIATVLVAFSE